MSEPAVIASGPALIGITTVTKTLDLNMREEIVHRVVNRRFGELVAQAGGVPVFVSPDADPDDLIARFDGFVINGGEDVSPDRYGAHPDPQLGPVDDERDQFELSLVAAARSRGKKVLGVCRGMHVVNVACGGTLIQHVPNVTELVHMDRERFDQPVHRVDLDSDSVIASILERESLLVNSVHHQAVADPGEGLTISARSEDGISEAIEGDEGRTLGVQWHPEFLSSKHDPVHLPLFRNLAA